MAGTNKRIGRLAAGVASVAAMSMALAGCGAGSGGAVDENGKPVVTVFANLTATTLDIQKLGFADALSKACGCTIKWEQTRDFSRQKTAMLAAGEIPDIAIAAFSSDDAARNPDAFEDLSDDLDKMPNLKSYLKDYPIASAMAHNGEGKIYALPAYDGKLYRTGPSHMFINKVWLDKLGLEVPTTWDEFEEVLQAFKTQDPNGNGEADEIPFNLAPLDTESFGWYSPFLLLNSTGLVTQMSSNSGAGGYYVRDGKVGNFMVAPEMKEVITYLHKLMSEGLVPSDALTKDTSAYNSEKSGDGVVARSGAIFGWTALGEFGKLSDQYVSIPVPKAEASMSDSERVWDAGRENSAYYGGRLSVSANAKNKEAVFKIVNELFSEKTSVIQKYGPIPEYVTDEGSHTYSISPKRYEDPSVDQSIGSNGPKAVRDDVTIKGDTKAEQLQKADEPLQEIYDQMDWTKTSMPINAELSMDDQNAVAQRNVSIFGYAMPKIAGWVTKGGVDKEWDAYVKNLNDTLGLKDSVAAWQRAYEAALKEL